MCVEGAFEALFVWGEDGEGGFVGGAGGGGGAEGAEAFEEVGGVGALGDPFGADEGGEFDLVEAGGAEEFDEAGLVLGWDGEGFVLESVARRDVGDADVAVGSCV